MRDVGTNSTGGEAALRLGEAATALLETMPPAAPFLRALPALAPSRAPKPATLPVLRWLNGMAGSSPPATRPLAAAVADAAAGLRWRQSYSAADFGPDFLDNYGWTELIGTQGPIPSEAVACGVLLLGPHTHYPAHAHEAEELYVPLAGTARWRRGDDAPQPVPPGTPIHHPSWLPHAMQTGAEPLLALYCWRGGALGAKPLILDQA